MLELIKKAMFTGVGFAVLTKDKIEEGNQLAATGCEPPEAECRYAGAADHGDGIDVTVLVADFLFRIGEDMAAVEEAKEPARRRDAVGAWFLVLGLGFSHQLGRFN